MLKSTFHKCVCNLIGVPNPTQSIKFDKYRVKTKIEFGQTFVEICAKLVEIFLYEVVLPIEKKVHFAHFAAPPVTRQQ